MNLITGSPLHSFEHATKKISVIHGSCIDLETHALIKKTGEVMIVVSHVNLKEKYGLDCDIVSFNEKDLYVYRTNVSNPPTITYYELSKKLTEDKLSLEDIICGKKKTCESAGDAAVWMKENAGFVVNSITEVNGLWHRYCQETGNRITEREWTKIFSTLYAENHSTGVFTRGSTCQMGELLPQPV